LANTIGLLCQYSTSSVWEGVCFCLVLSGYMPISSKLAKMLKLEINFSKGKFMLSSCWKESCILDVSLRLWEPWTKGSKRELLEKLFWNVWNANFVLDEILYTKYADSRSSLCLMKSYTIFLSVFPLMGLVGQWKSFIPHRTQILFIFIYFYLILLSD
jgi:hypothetical protein